MRSVDVNADAEEAKEGIHHEARSKIKSQKPECSGCTMMICLLLVVLLLVVAG